MPRVSSSTALGLVLLRNDSVAFARAMRPIPLVRKVYLRGCCLTSNPCFYSLPIARGGGVTAVSRPTRPQPCRMRTISQGPAWQEGRPVSRG